MRTPIDHPEDQRVPAASPASDLPRAIGLPRATAMVVGTIIGASIFVQPSLVSGAVPSVAGVLLVWVVAGALTLIGALVTAELASAFPRAGGVYVFLTETYSPVVGFLWGWAMFWSMHTGIIAAIATVFARYAGHFVPLGGAGQRALAIAAILVLSAVNYVGVRQGSALQTGFTAVKVLAILAIIVLGVGSAATPGPGGAPLIPSARAFGSALVAGLFAYGGWHMVTYAADETRDPARTIPRALLIGTAVVTACYVAVNAAYLAVLPLARVVSSGRVAADFADAVLGAGGAAAMSALVVVSTVGAMTGIILAGPRVYLAMAEDGLLFRWARAIHPTFRTPHRMIVLQAAWASVLAATGTYSALLTRVIYTEWIFFALMTAGLFLLRRRAGYAPRYRVWGYPLVPAVFILSTAAIVANQIATEPRDSVAGLLIVLAGVPVYFLGSRWWGVGSGSPPDSRLPTPHVDPDPREQR
jgi:APA family basic amino acid/polyamine antiporter